MSSGAMLLTKVLCVPESSVGTCDDEGVKRAGVSSAA